MAAKIAGIDVHKKILMVVVMECAHAGAEAGTATVRHHARRIATLIDMAHGAGCRRSGESLQKLIWQIHTVNPWKCACPERSGQCGY